MWCGRAYNRWDCFMKYENCQSKPMKYSARLLTGIESSWWLIEFTREFRSSKSTCVFVIHWNKETVSNCSIPFHSPSLPSNSSWDHNTFLSSKWNKFENWKKNGRTVLLSTRRYLLCRTRYQKKSWIVLVHKTWILNAVIRSLCSHRHQISPLNLDNFRIFFHWKMSMCIYAITMSIHQPMPDANTVFGVHVLHCILFGSENLHIHVLHRVKLKMEREK